MNLMEKMAEVAPDKFNFLFKEARDEIRSSPFREEIVQEMDFIVKTAEEMVRKIAFDFGSIGRGMGKAIGEFADQPLPKFIGATVAAGVATNLAGDLYEAARRGLTKSRHYSAMLEANPDLAIQAKEDPNVKMMFDTLHRFNPEFSGDPHTAASFVKAQLEYPDDISLPQQLVSSRKNIRDAQNFRIPGGIPIRTQADLDAQKAQMESNKAQAFKTRQEGQQQYNKRMGMVPGDVEENRSRNRNR